MGYLADTKNAVYLFGVYTFVLSFPVVFALTFRAFEKMVFEDVKGFMNDNPVLIDVRGLFDEKEAELKGFCYKRL